MITPGTNILRSSRQAPLVNFSSPGSTLLGDRRRAKEPVTDSGGSALLTLYETSIGLAKRLLANEGLTRDEQTFANDFPYQVDVSTIGLIPATVRRLEQARDHAIKTGKGDLQLALGIQGAIGQLNEEQATGVSPIDQALNRNQSTSRIILA